MYTQFPTTQIPVLDAAGLMRSGARHDFSNPILVSKASRINLRSLLACCHQLHFIDMRLMSREYSNE